MFLFRSSATKDATQVAAHGISPPPAGREASVARGLWAVFCKSVATVFKSVRGGNCGSQEHGGIRLIRQSPIREVYNDHTFECM